MQFAHMYLLLRALDWNSVIIVIVGKWPDRKLQGNNNCSYYPGCELSAQWQAVLVFALSPQVDDFLFFSLSTKRKEKKKKTPCCCETSENKKGKEQQESVKGKTLKETCFLSPLMRETITGVEGWIREQKNEEERQRNILSSAWLCGEMCHQCTM